MHFCKDKGCKKIDGKKWQHEVLGSARNRFKRYQNFPHTISVHRQTKANTHRHVKTPHITAPSPRRCIDAHPWICRLLILNDELTYYFHLIRNQLCFVGYSLLVVTANSLQNIAYKTLCLKTQLLQYIVSSRFEIFYNYIYTYK